MEEGPYNLTRLYFPFQLSTPFLTLVLCYTSYEACSNLFFCSLHYSLKILARLMTAKFLHTEIREKGGAYGGGAKLSHSGIFTLYSYR